MRFSLPFSSSVRAACLGAVGVSWLAMVGCAPPTTDSGIPYGVPDSKTTAAVVAGDPVSGTNQSRTGSGDGSPATDAATGVSAATSDLSDVSAESPLRHYRVTEPGCCPLPFWSADSASVVFFFEPGTASDEVGLHSVPREGGAPTYVGGDPVGTQLGGRFSTLLAGDTITLTRAADGRVWEIDTDGAMLTLSADGNRAAWVEGLSNTVPGQRQPPGVNKVMDLESGAVETVDVPAGYLLGDWTTDGRWILTRQERESDLPVLQWFDPLTGETAGFFDGARLRTGRTSPGRTWIAISRTFEEDSAKNGLYLLATDRSAEPRRLELSGGYYWRNDSKLLVVPQQPAAASMTLWQVDAATGAAVALTDPETTPFRIAAGEWSVSPDGTHVVYRSADDDAIWVMRLPE